MRPSTPSLPQLWTPRERSWLGVLTLRMLTFWIPSPSSDHLPTFLQHIRLSRVGAGLFQKSPLIVVSFISVHFHNNLPSLQGEVDAYFPMMQKCSTLQLKTLTSSGPCPGLALLWQFWGYIHQGKLLLWRYWWTMQVVLVLTNYRMPSVYSLVPCSNSRVDHSSELPR